MINQVSADQIYPAIRNYAEDRVAEFEQIPESRKKDLRKLSGYIAQKMDAGDTANLTFICTHNSRRSHFGQIWSEVAASYYGIRENYESYSGGTEATAFNPRAVAALERVGFRIENPGGENPKYTLYYGGETKPIQCFSKTFDHSENPASDFAAVMTCSDADENCPFIPGTDLRAAITYEDPKVADNTPDEIQRYDQRCRQIAREMLYLMSEVSHINA